MKQSKINKTHIGIVSNYNFSLLKKAIVENDNSLKVITPDDYIKLNATDKIYIKVK